MSVNDFYHYMQLYSEEYYDKYCFNIDMVGDIFYQMKNEAELAEWIKRNGNYYVYSKRNVTRPKLFIHSNIENIDKMPAYAVALHELFYDEFDYFDDSGLPIQKKKTDMIQEDIAKVCHVARNTVASWKNCSRIPGKYNWWALAIGFLELSYQYLPPFMDMIGATVDLTCLDDVLLYYALCAEKTSYETYILLKHYNCETTAELFTPCD